MSVHLAQLDVIVHHFSVTAPVSLIRSKIARGHSQPILRSLGPSLKLFGLITLPLVINYALLE